VFPSLPLSDRVLLYASRKAPLTEEEETLQKVKDAEAEASRGTAARSSHIDDHFGPPMANDAADALKGLGYGTYNLVQLVSSRSNTTLASI
jgi:hypothetical protein